MNTIIRITVTIILSLVLMSCNFSMNLGDGIDGNGNVVNETREINQNFDEIKISQGLELYITQADEVALNIDADENLQDLIKTEVVNNVLSIYSTENIRRASSKIINLKIKDISNIKATSGSGVYGTNTITVNNLKINTTSGANLKLDIQTQNLECQSTSGSNIRLSGKTNALTAKATSGSNIKASDLIAESSNAKATSGAFIKVNTIKELTATATSGGNVRYLGNPEKVNSSDSSAGSVRQQ